jgi:hypothetical protein
MFENADDEVCNELGRVNMTPLISQTTMTGNPPGVSWPRLFL